MRIHTLALATTAAAFTITGAAQAAPNRTGTLGAPGAEYKWDGGPISGASVTTDVYDATGCVPGLVECDDTLLKVDAAGTVSVKTGDAGATAVDMDLFVYKSDAAGTQGKLLKSSGGGDVNESTSFDADPGYYLVRMEAATALQGTYKGTATLAAPSEDAEGDVPLTPLAPNPAPTTKVSKPKGKKITAIAGTAKDDSKVAKVAVGLVQVKGSTCYGLTARGSFKKLAKCTAPILLTAKGTTKWSLKLKKPLKKGKYVAYALATDDQGVAEGGYGPANKVAFTVR